MGLSEEAGGIFVYEEAALLARGKIHGNPGGLIRSVAIDSREARAGSLFVPLAGIRTNGHDHIAGAVQNGAAAVFVAAKEWKRRESHLMSLAAGGVTFIVVDDPLAAMQRLAKEHMNRLSGSMRIGITGSNGKTTTKEILGSVLKEDDATFINKGNLNSDIGLPLSVFSAGPSDKYIVLEMGMNYNGEMDILADIFRPQSALITNIGRAHIGSLGSVDAIANEKKKVFKFFDGSQNGFIREDEKYFSFLSAGVQGKIFSYGQRTTKGFEGFRSLGLDGMTIYWEELRIHLPLIGLYNLSNALGVLSLVSELGIDRKKVKRGLEKVKPLFGRSQIIRGEETVIRDCYNSNPDSVKSALEFVNNLSWEGRKIAVLGSMLELGERSASAHKEVVDFAVNLCMDMVYLFGEEMEPAFQRLKESEPTPCQCEWTTDFSVLLEKVLKNKRPGDLFLVKGSRGVELERLADKINNGGSVKLN